MGLFKPDFFRFFGFGFLAGAVLVLGSMGDGLSRELIPSLLPAAHAAAPAR